MSADNTKQVVQSYLDSAHGDTSMLAKDVVFTIMATGQENHGPEEVNGMLHYFYHVAFDARAVTRVLVCDEHNAVLEAAFVGKHIGEFAGIPATGKEVNVPMCIVYDVANNQIRNGRVYLEMPVLLQQLGVKPG
ncbi:MAG: ester cyclase [Anaerolineae bacterium]